MGRLPHSFDFVEYGNLACGTEKSILNGSVRKWSEKSRETPLKINITTEKVKCEGVLLACLSNTGLRFLFEDVVAYLNEIEKEQCDE